jgi:hypothetical protein
MKRHLIVFALMAIISKCYSQIDFEKGYFINNEGSRIECFIRNTEWINNPDKFKYKLDLNANAEEATILNVKEFGISNLRYIRVTVGIDQSSSDSRKFDNNRFPVWKNETIFLKLIVEGKANLYEYHTANFERFFYSVDNDSIRQLIYKQYIASTNEGGYYSGKGLQIRFNGGYLNQLEKDVSCGPKKPGRQKQLKFSKENLANYFAAYNSCNGGTSTIGVDVNKKTDFHLKIKAGADFSKLTINGYRDYDYPKETNYRLGFEGEIILPYNRNKWSVMFEPTFQTFKSTKIKNAPVTYNSIEIPFGARHYFFLNNDIKIFANLGCVLDIPLNFNIDRSGVEVVKFKIARVNAFAGLGLSIKRLSIEGRYFSNRTGLNTNDSYRFVYSKTSIVCGYRIF